MATQKVKGGNLHITVVLFVESSESHKTLALNNTRGMTTSDDALRCCEPKIPSFVVEYTEIFG